jgi:hypothetical protein
MKIGATPTPPHKKVNVPKRSRGTRTELKLPEQSRGHRPPRYHMQNHTISKEGVQPKVSLKLLFFAR